MASSIDKVKILQKCLIIKDGKILAIKRSTYDKCRAQCWDLPGGGYEEGEDILEAIKREVKEEVGLTIDNPQIIYICSGDKAIGKSTDGSHVFATCYLANDSVGDVTLSNEHTEFTWLPPSEFSKLDFGDDGGFFTSSLEAYINYQSI